MGLGLLVLGVPQRRINFTSLFAILCYVGWIPIVGVIPVVGTLFSLCMLEVYATWAIARVFKLTFYRALFAVFFVPMGLLLVAGVLAMSVLYGVSSALI